MHLRAAGHDGLCEFGRAGDDVFAVVDEQQRPARPQGSDDRLGQGVSGTLRDARRVGDRAGHIGRRRDLRQLDQPRVPPLTGGHRAGRRQRELSLADPSRPEQGHDRRPRERVGDGPQVRVAADQAAHPTR